MRNLDSIIQDLETTRQGGVTHRRPFLNLKSSRGYIKWQENRCYA
ncbi:hypothetical protein [Christiangramia sabulilitoris]|nr:hypothetical protein [Christiangramia sabulilitoris]